MNHRRTGAKLQIYPGIESKPFYLATMVTRQGKRFTVACLREDGSDASMVCCSEAPPRGCAECMQKEDGACRLIGSRLISVKPMRRMRTDELDVDGMCNLAEAMIRQMVADVRKDPSCAERVFTEIRLNGFLRAITAPEYIINAIRRETCTE